MPPAKPPGPSGPANNRQGSAPPSRLGPPDRPGRKPRKPKKPKLIAPKGYLGGWRTNPGLDPKKYKTIKTGQGYFIAKKLRSKAPKPKAGATGAAAAPAAPAGPYSEYAQTAPWAIPLLKDLDRTEQSHIGYVTGQVMPWLSQGLQNLTGVNPAAPGYNPTIQQQYLSNVQGIVGGAYNAAAAATPAQFAPTTPGASTAAPNAYQGAAMQQYSANMGSAAMQSAQAHSALNTLQPNIFAQSALRTMADYAAGLPQVYIQKRNELRAKIDQFVMEQQAEQADLAEQMRHNKVTEAISGQNAMTNAAIQFGRLGLSADELAGEQRIASQKEADAAAQAGAPVPYGYVRLPDGRYVRDPQVPSARAPSTGGGSSGGGTGPSAPSPSKGQYPPNKLRKEGFVGGWKVKPKKGGPYVRATDGTWWRKPKGSSGGSSSGGSERRTIADLTMELGDLYKKGDIGGWEERYDGDPAGAARQLALWVRENKPSFITSGRLVNINTLRNVLDNIGGRPAAEALRILVRGYMKKVNGRLVWK